MGHAGAYERLKEITATEAEAYFGSGGEKLMKKDYTGAIADFTKAIELNPKNALVYFTRGWVKDCSLKDYTGAIKDYTKAIELGHENVMMAYNNRGFAKIRLEDYAGAITDLTKVIEIKPEFAEAYYNRGFAKGILKDYTGAREDLSKAGELGYTEAYEAIKEINKQKK